MERAVGVDEYIAEAEVWRTELRRLRRLLLSTELEECVKWGGPCYTVAGKNVVGLGAFKSYFGLWFFQGALLEDRHKLLVNAQEGKTRALRQWRMRSAREIRPALVKQYVEEAIRLARQGRGVAPERKKKLVVPPQLKQALRDDRAAADRFRLLSPGLRREYADYISEAKREETKLRRVKKILPMIAAGVGLNDKYRRPATRGA